MVAAYNVRAMLTVHLVLAFGVGYNRFVRAGTFSMTVSCRAPVKSMSVSQLHDVKLLSPLLHSSSTVLQKVFL